MIIKHYSLALLLFLCLPVFCFSQGKIDRSKAEIKAGLPNQPAVSTPSHSNNESSSDDGKTFGQQIAEVIGKGILILTFYSTVGDYEHEDHLKNALTKYPFYNKFSGNYEMPDTTKVSGNRFRLDMDYRFLYSNKKLTGHDVYLNIRPFQYFYLEANYKALTEVNSDSANADRSLLNVNFCYDRIRFERLNIGWKAGICYIGNNIDKTGFSIGLDGEAFIFRSVSIAVSKQWSRINHVPVNFFEAFGKFHQGRYSFQLGYQHLKIGTPLYDYVSVGVGVKL